MPTPFDYDPEAFAQLQQLLSGIGESFSKSYRDRPQEPFLSVEDLAGALSGIPMEPGAAPDVSGAIEGLGQAASRFLPKTTGYRTPMPTPGAIPANEPGGEGFGLAGVVAQEPEWRPIPGDPTGKFRDPGTGTRFKGGPFYVSERPAGVPEWQRPESVSDIQQRTSNTRLGLFKRFSEMDPTEARTRMYQRSGLDKPYWSTDELFKQIVELPSKEAAEALISPEAKERRSIAEAEKVRQENAWLASVISGGKFGMAPGGLSAAGLKSIQQILESGRADERLRQGEDRLAGIERRERRARPPELAIDKRAADILAREKGYAVKKIEGTYYVLKNATSRTPITDSAKVWADARQRAETDLRSGAR